MRYLLMLYADEKAGAAIPKAEMDGYMQMMFAYQAALEKAGAFVMTSPLRPTTAAKTVYTEAGELKVHDAPMPRRASSSAAFTSSRPGTWTKRSAGPANAPAPGGAMSRCASWSPATDFFPKRNVELLSPLPP